MGRKEDLEGLLGDSYTILYEYEQVIQTSDRAEEIVRARRKIAEQWLLIKGHLNDYIALCERLQASIPNDLLEIIAHFPEYVEHLQKAAVTQAAGELQETLCAQGLTDPTQVTHFVTSTLSAERPLLFETGLCPGFRLEPSPHEYFVAQEFSADRDDLLHALDVAFREFALKPYRADQDIHPGHILCKIAAKIQTTLFGVFELTRTQNRNVYLELGIAISLGRPFVLVKESDAEVSPLTRGLNYYSIRSYISLQRELGERLRQYLLNIAHYRIPSLPPVGSNCTYVIAHGDHDMPPDFCLAVAEALAPRGLTPMLIGANNDEAAEVLESSGFAYQTVQEGGKTALDAVVQAIQASHFGIYRIDADCYSDAFLALGIAIGLNRPWTLVNRRGAVLPADVQGLNGLEFGSFLDLHNLLVRRFSDS